MKEGPVTGGNPLDCDKYFEKLLCNTFRKKVLQYIKVVSILSKKNIYVFV